MSKPYPSDYEGWDRFRVVWVPSGWFRIAFKVVDTTREPEGMIEKSYHVGDRMCAVVAEGKAWTLNGVRRKAFASMELEVEYELAEAEKVEMGGYVAFKVDAERRADREV